MSAYPDGMMSRSLLRALPVLFPTLALVSAQGTVAPQCPDQNGQVVTSGSNQYRIYCGQDSTPGAFGGTPPTAPSLTACMALCDASSNCRTATYAANIQTCYLKPLATSFTTNTGLATAVRIYNGPYPAPQANYINASAGCGTALPLGLTPGGATQSYTYIAPDLSTRQYRIHIPTGYDINKAAPLIMAFHGRSSSGTAHEAETGYSTSGVNPYAIAVYPEGANVSLNPSF